MNPSGIDVAFGFVFALTTRMHSSRMRTVRSSGRRGECLTRKGVSDQGGGSAQGGV